MAEKFDPYHKWLGISPKDQPPNYYRLLGIDLYESDPEVISAAAKRAGTFVQKETTGPHAEIARKLLQRISAVRKVLLDAQTRAAYDAKLRGLASTITPPPARGASTPPATGVPQPPVAKAVSPADAKAARAKPLASVSAVPMGTVSNQPAKGEAAKVKPAPAPPDAPPVGSVGAKPGKGPIAKVSLAPVAAEPPPVAYEAPPIAAPPSSRNKGKAKAAKATKAVAAEAATGSRRSQKKSQKSQPKLMIVGIAVAVLVIVGCIVTFAMMKRGGEVAVKTPAAKHSASEPAAEEAPAAAAAADGPAADEPENPQLALADAARQGKAMPAKGAARGGKPTPELIQLVLKEAAIEEIKSLVAGGAAIDDTDANGFTALRMAVIKDNPDLVAALIELKANVNLGDTWGETPLMSAAQAGKVNLVETLLAAGADLNAATKLAPSGDGGVTALLLAVRHGQTEVVETLLDKMDEKKGDFEQANYAGVTPLMLAAAFGQAEIVDLLVKKGADVNKRDKSGQTPLMYAAYGGKVAIIDGLLKKGALCHSKTPEKVTAVRVAAGRENGEAFDKLVDAGEKEAPEIEGLPQ